MADFHKAIPAIPADLRGQEMPIPAGYLYGNKESAGIAGIGSGTFTREGTNLVCHMRLHAPEQESAGFYPRFPRRPCVFNYLTCGDRLGKTVTVTWIRDVLASQPGS